jgi:hypothetical protein
MSVDALVSLALDAGALFLMTRLGCGGHIGHARRHGAPNPNKADGASAGFASSVNSATPFTSADSAPARAGSAPKGTAHRYG